jgi:hypothetical protein
MICFCTSSTALPPGVQAVTTKIRLLNNERHSLHTLAKTLLLVQPFLLSALLRLAQVSTRLPSSSSSPPLLSTNMSPTCTAFPVSCCSCLHGLSVKTSAYRCLIPCLTISLLRHILHLDKSSLSRRGGVVSPLGVMLVTAPVCG